MLKKTKTICYIAEAEIKIDGVNGHLRALHKAENSARSVYQMCLDEALKRLHKLQHDRQYQKIQAEIKELVKKNHVNGSKKKTTVPADLSQQLLDLKIKYEYSDFSLQAWATAHCGKMYPSLGADERANCATRAFLAVDKIRTGKAKKVRYPKAHEPFTFEGKSRSRLHYDSVNQCVFLGKKEMYPLIIKPNDQYLMLALHAKCKRVRLQKRVIRGKERWFAQLVMEGYPPATRNQTFAKDGVMGVDIGTSTIAIYTKGKVELKELAPECNKNDRQIRKLQRAMDRSRRATNPDNFNADGTVKKGKKLEWKNSKRYVQLRTKLSETYRKNAAIKLVSHHVLAKEIVAKAADIRVEDMNFMSLQKRKKKNSVSKKDGRQQSKKRYGKTVANHAPGMLMRIINQKLGYAGRQLNEVNSFTVRASQYNPLTGEYKKHGMKRMLNLGTDENGKPIIVQRDMLSAYLIAHTDDSLSVIDADSALKDFETFREMQNKEVQKLKDTNTLSWYIS